MSTTVVPTREIVGTAGEDSTVAISNNTSILSPTEKANLKRKRKRVSIASGVSILSGLPVAALASVSVAALHGWSGGINEALTAGIVPLALSLGSHFTLEHFGARYGAILDDDDSALEEREKARSSQRARVELENWQKSTMARLQKRFAVDLTLEEFEKLQYPRELPTAERTIRYGSIDKYLSLEDGSGALQQVTLIWAEGEMKLLTTRLTELGITR